MMAPRALTLAAACLLLAVGAGASGPRAYPGITVGDRAAGAPEAQACACVDAGLNEQACFTGVTRYCQGARPNATVCSAMSDFFNNQDLAAARIAAAFFMRACAAAVPAGANACACTEGATTPGCKAATLSACALGNSICPALAFPADANTGARESLAKFMAANCGGALAAAEVGLNFTAITKADFLNKYSKGTAQALAVISGQALPAVLLLSSEQIKTGSLVQSAGAGAGGARRRLAQSGVKVVDKVITRWQIRSSPDQEKLVLERLNLAAADGGAGLYKALAANGVPLRPSLSVQGGAPLVGGVARRALKFDQPEPLDAGEITGIVVGAVGGAALVGGLVWWLLRRRRARAAGGAKAAAAAGQGREGGGGKPVEQQAAVGSVGTSVPAAADSGHAA